ncbi:MAG TPA: radical SAM protein, partial [Myxococcaceae bacterium]|nr:radical SAM protein [Myxococcaceae bacterium]
SIRVSLNSAVKDLYEAYYQPHRYQFEDVEASMALSRRRGAYLALNLLLFPGVSDRQGEVEALIRLIHRHRVDQLQTRSLCIDPLQYLEVACGRGAGGLPIGVRRMLREIKRAAPWLVIGNFSRGLRERGLSPRRSPAPSPAPLPS